MNYTTIFHYDENGHVTKAEIREVGALNQPGRVVDVLTGEQAEDALREFIEWNMSGL